MAYSEHVAERIRRLLKGKRGVTEKKMFGGLSFFVGGKMAIGVLKDDLVVHVDPKEADALLKSDDVRPMDFTGKPMKGWLYVSEGGYSSESSLSSWVERGIAFAKRAPKK